MQTSQRCLADTDSFDRGLGWDLTRKAEDPQDNIPLLFLRSVTDDSDRRFTGVRSDLAEGYLQPCHRRDSSRCCSRYDDHVSPEMGAGTAKRSPEADEMNDRDKSQRVNNDGAESRGR